MLQRVLAGTGLAALVVAATLWPAATASPAADKTSICQAYQAEETKQTKANVFKIQIPGEMVYTGGPISNLFDRYAGIIN